MNYLTNYRSEPIVCIHVECEHLYALMIPKVLLLKHSFRCIYILDLILSSEGSRLSGI